MRLFSLAIVVGIGILVGVLLYAAQSIFSPSHQNTKLASKTLEKAMFDDGLIREVPATPFTAAETPSKPPVTQAQSIDRSQLPTQFQTAANGDEAPVPSSASLGVPSLNATTQTASAHLTNPEGAKDPAAPATAYDAGSTRPEAPIVNQPTTAPSQDNVNKSTNVQFAMSNSDGVKRTKTIVTR